MAAPGDDDDDERPASAVLCAAVLAVSALQSVSPAETYIHEYLVRVKQLPGPDVASRVWPAYTYTFALALIPITYVSEYVAGYAVVIAVAIALRLATSFLHELAPVAALWPHQVSLALFGVACACKVSFKSFTYAVVPARTFFAMTGYLRASNLVAHVVGGCVGWALRRRGADWALFFLVQQVSLGTALLSFVVGIVLSHRHPAAGGGRRHRIGPIQSPKAQVCPLIRSAYRDPVVARWSTWYIVTYAVFEFVHLHTSSLFFTIDPTATWNGVVVGAARLSAAVASLAASKLQQARSGAVVPCASVLAAALILLAGCAPSVSVAYAAIVGVHVCLDFCFCIVSAVIALHVPTSVRGVVMFLNTFLSLLVQSALQLVTGTLLAVTLPVKFAVCSAVTLGAVVVAQAVSALVASDHHKASNITSPGGTGPA